MRTLYNVHFIHSLWRIDQNPMNFVVWELMRSQNGRERICACVREKEVTAEVNTKMQQNHFTVQHTHGTSKKHAICKL